MIFLVVGEAGRLLANNLNSRRKELANLIYALGLLKTELVYADIFLGESLFRIGNAVAGEIGGLLVAAAKHLKDDSGCNGLLLALAEYRASLPFREEEYEIIERLGSGLGTRDLESELRRIDYAVKSAEMALSSATELQKKWGRVYGVGGWLCGLTAALFIL